MKMRHLLLPLGMFISLQLGYGQESEIQWLSGPGIQHQCSGDDVTLTWTYNVQYDISFVRMTDTEKSLHTVALYDFANNLTTIYPEQFKERISFEIVTLEQTSILVCNITQADAGSYFLILDGPIGEKNRIQLLVFEENELEPFLSVENKPQTFGECFDLEVGDERFLILTPGSGLPADISIFADDMRVEFCLMARSCGYHLNSSTPSHQNLTFLFNYGACEPVKRGITAVVTGSADSYAPHQPVCSRNTDNWKIVVGVVVAVVVTCAGAIVIYSWVKKNRKSTKPISPVVTMKSVAETCDDEVEEGLIPQGYPTEEEIPNAQDKTGQGDDYDQSVVMPMIKKGDADNEPTSLDITCTEYFE